MARRGRPPLLNSVPPLGGAEDPASTEVAAKADPLEVILLGRMTAKDRDRYLATKRVSIRSMGDMARDFTDDMIAQLGFILEFGDFDQRLRAIEILANRGWGKPTENVTVTSGNRDESPAERYRRMLEEQGHDAKTVRELTQETPPAVLPRLEIAEAPKENPLLPPVERAIVQEQQ